MKIRVKIQTIKTLVFLLMMIFATSLTAMAQEKVSGIVKDDTGESFVPKTLNTEIYDEIIRIKK